VIDPAPETQLAPTRFTVEQYFGLVEAGLLEEDDRVELLEGVVVSMSPRTARHDAGVCLVHEALRTAVGDRGVVRVQCTLVLPPHRAPEPDVAVVPGTLRQYDTQHPTTALLVVEVADASVPQDRITKGRMYAAAGVPEYWILNLRDDQVEVHRAPDPTAGVYREVYTARAGDELTPALLPDAHIAVADVIPER
jgi:Uma2 family endonuclease